MEAVAHERWVFRRPSQEPRTCMCKSLGFIRAKAPGFYFLVAGVPLLLGAQIYVGGVLRSKDRTEWPSFLGPLLHAEGSLEVSITLECNTPEFES